MALADDNFVITPHALFEMRRRDLDDEVVRNVLASPEQRYSVRHDRDVRQSIINIGNKAYLLRVFVDVDREPAEVVTACLTSRVAKYWRPGP